MFLSKKKLTEKTKRPSGKILFVLLVLVFFGAACNKKDPEQHESVLFETGTAAIAGHILNIQIAKSPMAQAQGLSGRDFLAENDGMLFSFQTPGKPAFWMKDTRIPLDFIWIRGGSVVEITRDVRPEPNVTDGSLRRYLPVEPVDSMIEVNAGWTAKNVVKAGDSVVLNKH